jgi:hypothetical protein
MSDAAHDGEAHGTGALQTAKDLFAGAAGGIAQVLLGENISSRPRNQQAKAWKI